jgi:integrase/recombinase XerD
MIETPIRPLRRRMIEDITVRKFGARTQEGYIRAVKGSSAFLGVPPDTPGPEDLRRYRLHLVAAQPGLPPPHRWPRSTSAPRCTCCGTARQ